MKTTRTTLFAAMLCLAAAISPVSGQELIHVKGRIFESHSLLQDDVKFSSYAPGMYQTETEIEAALAKGELRILARPDLAIPAGESAVLKIVHEFSVPTAYDPPVVPEDSVHPLKPEGLSTHEANFLLPPVPKQFEKREAGLILKITARLDRDGRPQATAEIQQISLVGFEDRGTPVTLEKTGPLGKEKSIPLIEASQLYPHFDRQNWSISAADGMKFLQPSSNPKFDPEKWSLIVGQKANGAADMDYGFVPSLFAQLEAEKVKMPDKLRPREGAPEDRQIFFTTKVIESSEPLDIPSPVLGEADLQQFVRSVNTQKHVDLLSAPSMVMRSGQQGKIEVIREFVYPTDYEAPEIPEIQNPVSKPDFGARPRKKRLGERISEHRVLDTFPVTPSKPVAFETESLGVMFQVVAKSQGDGTISLQMSPQVVEQAGFFNFGQPIVLPDTGPLGKTRLITLSENRVESPVFRRRKMEAHVRLPDGASYVFGGLVTTDRQSVQDKVPILGDLPIIGRAARSEMELEVHRYLYFIVTAQEIDPAGLPIRKSD
ncbi:MAG: hypothetical protein HKN23_05805 [Verrucomicrobiales bacterium]|nr:hypothetical protein [Verrucomicrobiales bacterium]